MRMFYTFRLLPIRARIMLLLAVWSIGALMISVFSQFGMVGRPVPGVLLQWSHAANCDTVAPITPAVWPALADGTLRPGDCVAPLGKDSLSILAARAVAPGAQPTLQLEAQSGEARRLVEVVPFRLTTTHILQFLLPIALIGFSFGLLGLLVLLARPDLEVNQVCAALFFSVTLTIAGLYHNLIKEGYYFSASAAVVALPFIGATLWHLAWITTQTPGAPLKRWLVLALYPAAILSVLLHETAMFNLFGLNSWNNLFVIVAMALNGLLMLIGLGMLLFRLIRAVRRPGADQARVLLISWGLGQPPLILAAAVFLIGGRWGMAGSSLQAFLLFLIPVCSGTAYAMLRYQAFAYRGYILGGLTAFFASATIAGIVMLLIPYRTDGIQFALIWGGTLLATLFWYVDNPVRHAFQRFFLRHQRDYAIAHQFAQRLNQATDTPTMLDEAALTLRQELSVTWAALVCTDQPASCWLADQAGLQRLVLPDNNSLPCLPSPPAHTEYLLAHGTPIGALWIGPRRTAEPLDHQDTRLIGLLADYLANALVIQAHLRYLAGLPGMILEAQEQERGSIAHELHDAVLPFFGALPLALGNTQHLPESQVAVQQRLIDRSRFVSGELRGMMHRLSRPDLAGEQLPPALHSLLASLCEPEPLTLNWNVSGSWANLPEADALQAYRVVQQAVTNAIQHAQPRTISVDLAASEDGYRFTVRDDGPGFDPTRVPDGHFGLISMRERARAAGGQVMISSAPGHGSRIELYLPAPDRRIETTDHLHLFPPMDLPAPALNASAPDTTGPAWRIAIPTVALTLSLALGTLAIDNDIFTPPICDNAQPVSCVVRANHTWQPTGLRVSSGQIIHVRAISGQWTNGPDAGFFDANGNASHIDRAAEASDAPIGALIVRVERELPFEIGVSADLPAPFNGQLYLMMNDDICNICQADNYGEVVVEITLGPP